MCVCVWGGGVVGCGVFWCVCGEWVVCVGVWGVCGGVGVCAGGVRVCVWGGWGVCVRPGIQSEDQNQFFTFKVRTFWQSEVKISVLALWLCALSSLCHNMGVGGGMGVILSLYVPGMFRGVWKNVLTLNVLYTDLSSLWMPGRTHYTHVCILCPHFECRAR